MLVAIHSILLNKYFNLPLLKCIEMVFVVTSTARTKAKLRIPMKHPPSHPVITCPDLPLNRFSEIAENVCKS